MKKPANKAAWISAAKAVGAELASKMTIKEIVRSIGDKLGVNPRGAGYENRVVKAIAVELDIEKADPPKETVVVPPSNGAVIKNKVEPKEPKAEKVIKGSKKVSCKVLVNNRKGSMLIDTGKKQVWIKISKLLDSSGSHVTIPDWLANMKGI